MSFPKLYSLRFIPVKIKEIINITKKTILSSPHISTSASSQHLERISYIKFTLYRNTVVRVNLQLTQMRPKFGCMKQSLGFKYKEKYQTLNTFLAIHVIFGNKAGEGKILFPQQTESARCYPENLGIGKNINRFSLTSIQSIPMQLESRDILKTLVGSKCKIWEVPAILRYLMSEYNWFWTILYQLKMPK